MNDQSYRAVSPSTNCSPIYQLTTHFSYHGMGWPDTLQLVLKPPLNWVFNSDRKVSITQLYCRNQTGGAFEEQMNFSYIMLWWILRNCVPISRNLVDLSRSYSWDYYLFSMYTVTFNIIKTTNRPIWNLS